MCGVWTFQGLAIGRARFSPRRRHRAYAPMALPCIRADKAVAREGGCPQPPRPQRTAALPARRTGTSHRTRAGSMPARSQRERAHSKQAPGTPLETPKDAPRPTGLDAGHWLLAAEVLPTHQKSALSRVSGENGFLMRWPKLVGNGLHVGYHVARRADGVPAAVQHACELGDDHRHGTRSARAETEQEDVPGVELLVRERRERSGL